jgi:hypothetical protein
MPVSFRPTSQDGEFTLLRWTQKKRFLRYQPMLSRYTLNTEVAYTPRGWPEKEPPMSDLKPVNWELVRLYLSDAGREVGDLITLLPPGDVADVLQREKMRIEGEEKIAKEQLEEAQRRFEELGAFAEEFAQYNINPAVDKLDSLRTSLRTLEELGRIEVLYVHRAFEQTSQALVADFHEITQELLQYFAQHPNELHQMEWRKFEYLLDAIFRNQGYRTELGPGRADAGVDLRLVQKDSIGEIVTLVQAKRYAPKNAITLDAVSALYGVVEDQQANRGLFVTTSRYLPSATRFAAKHSQRLVLADSSDVARWCHSIASNRIA